MLKQILLVLLWGGALVGGMAQASVQPRAQEDKTVGGLVAGMSPEQRAHAIFMLTRDIAQDGDPEEAYKLGMMYLAGAGVEKDTHEGLIWIEKAAQQGHLEAIVLLEKLKQK